MKNLAKLTLFVAITLFMIGCGSNAKDNLIGNWKVDPSSLEINLGDGIPEEYKTMINEGKKEMTEEASREANKVNFEFKDDGKMVVSAEGEKETFEFDWEVNGEKLKINGEVEGQKFEVELDIQESTADKLTLALTGEYILNEIKKQAPMALAGAPEGMDLAKMAEGTSVAISFKKG